MVCSLQVRLLADELRLKVVAAVSGAFTRDDRYKPLKEAQAPLSAFKFMYGILIDTTSL